MNTIFTKKYLLAALKAAGLPCTYPTLVRYERDGIVQKPKGEISFNDRNWRLYTKEEIEEAVSAVMAYQNSKKEPTPEYPEIT